LVVTVFEKPGKIVFSWTESTYKQEGPLPTALFYLSMVMVYVSADKCSHLFNKSKEECPIPLCKFLYKKPTFVG